MLGQRWRARSRKSERVESAEGDGEMVKSEVSFASIEAVVELLTHLFFCKRFESVESGVLTWDILLHFHKNLDPPLYMEIAREELLFRAKPVNRFNAARTQ